jgi:hypothetical protein
MSQMHGTASYEAGTHGTPPRHPGQGRAALPLTPARRVALLIGVPVCLALTGYVGFDLVAMVGKGQFHFSHTFAASTRQLSVNAGGGDVVVEAAASGPARLSGEAYYSLIRPTITERASADSAALAYPCGLPAGNCGLNATVSVPAGIAVAISSGGGDLTASGLSGHVSLSADGGDLTATGITGEVSLQTGGGDLTATRLAGVLDLGASGGDITATSIDSPQVTADSGGGDVEIVFTQVPQDVQVSAAGGDVTIVVPAGPTTYDVTATANGGSLDDSVPQASSSPRKITVSSGGGDLTIEQST